MTSSADSVKAEAFLSGAFGRIQQISVVLALATVSVSFLLFGWRSGLGSVIGSVAGILNMAWLHHGAAMMIERVLAAANKPPAKSRLVLTFIGRYVFLMAIAYVILKGFPSMLWGFAVALFLPLLAAMCEGFYEAFVNIKVDETPKGTSVQ